MPKDVLRLLVLLIMMASVGAAAAKAHLITFGKWASVPWLPGGEAQKPLMLKVRGLFLDGRLKEYTVGPFHEVTDRLFVVRRAFRMNDNLPDDPAFPPRWQWQRGGWLVVDRLTGHISPIPMPEFDAYYSAAGWYRDYAAYCGVSEDGKQLYAVVAQLGRRKPVLKKLLGSNSIEADDSAPPDSACPAPLWQRTPARVTFEPSAAAKQTFAIRGHVVDLVNETEEDEEPSK